MELAREVLRRLGLESTSIEEDVDLKGVEADGEFQA